MRKFHDARLRNLRSLRASLRAAALIALAGVALAGCALPNPYEPPSPNVPRPPPSGEPPDVPTQEPEQPPPAPEEAPQPPERRTREYQLGAASRSLVAQAQTQSANGDFAGAAASIERALRIEPSNPLLWLELGKVRQEEGNYAQAESMGRKTLSLATGDARLQSRAWSLVAESLRARGRTPQAREAEQKAEELVPR